NGTVTWSPAVLWPPNHKMVRVTINWTEPSEATDPLGLDSDTLSIDSINSIGVDDKGAGQPSSKQGPDYAIVKGSDTVKDGTQATVTADLRAERSGTDKAGRTYEVNL